MADDTDSLRFLRSELERMQKENADLRAEAKSRRLKSKDIIAERDALRAERDELLAQAKEEFDALDSELADLKAERDEWKGKAELAPDEVAKQLQAAHGEIRMRDLKDAFRPVAEQLGDKVTLEQLWKLNDFDPSSVDPKEVKVDDLVSGWKEATPALFKGETPTPPPGGATQGKAKPAMRVDEYPGRGGRDTTPGRIRYTKAEIAKSDWYAKNPGLLEAIQNGTAEMVE